LGVVISATIRRRDIPVPPVRSASRIGGNPIWEALRSGGSLLSNGH